MHSHHFDLSSFRILSSDIVISLSSDTQAVAEGIFAKIGGSTYLKVLACGVENLKFLKKNGVWLICSCTLQSDAKNQDDLDLDVF